VYPPRRRHIAVATTAAVALSITPGVGSEAPTREPNAPAQSRVDSYLRAHPGGKQINATQVSYNNGAFIVTVPDPANPLAASACPSGWFCFYDEPNFEGHRGQLSSCGWQDLAWYGWSDRTYSARYSLSTGTVMFINHAGGSGHAGDVNLFWVGTSRRELANVSPNHKKADHVRRSC
jgi:hypothetical protein